MWPVRRGLATAVLVVVLGAACDDGGPTGPAPVKDCQVIWGGALTATINGTRWGPVRAAARDDRGSLVVRATDCVYDFSLSGPIGDGPGIYTIGGRGLMADLSSAEAWRATTVEGRGRGVVELSVFTTSRVAGTFIVEFDQVITMSGTGVVIEGRFEERLDCAAPSR